MRMPSNKTRVLPSAELSPLIEFTPSAKLSFSTNLMLKVNDKIKYFGQFNVLERYQDSDYPITWRNVILCLKTELECMLTL